MRCCPLPYLTSHCRVTQKSVAEYWLLKGDARLFVEVIRLPFPRPSTGPPSPNSPKLLRGLLEKLPRQLGVLWGVSGELLRRLRKSAVSLALKGRGSLCSSSPAPRVSPAVSPAVCAAVLGNSGLGALRIWSGECGLLLELKALSLLIFLMGGLATAFALEFKTHRDSLLESTREIDRETERVGEM